MPLSAVLKTIEGFVLKNGKPFSTTVSNIGRASCAHCNRERV